MIVLLYRNDNIFGHTVVLFMNCLSDFASNTCKITLSIGEAISGGKLVIEVSYFGIHVETETHDLCTETSCPVSAGDFVISHSQLLPAFTPPVSHRFILIIETR